MNAISMNLQILFSGLSVGAVYSLIALGFVLIIRATNVVNFAQGDFAMLGAFAMMTALTSLKLPFWLSFIVAIRYVHPDPKMAARVANLVSTSPSRSLST